MISLVLGVISLIWLALDFAALTDIWHGLEPNYDMEWQIVSWGFIPLTLFHISALVTLTLFLRANKKQQGVLA